MRCYYCDCEISREIAEGTHTYGENKKYAVRDHLFPKSLGGGVVPDFVNLVDCCNECNSKKCGNHPLKFYHEYDFTHWSKSKVNDFMWRIKMALIVINSHDPSDIELLYRTKKPNGLLNKKTGIGGRSKP